jgi:hypothetical protein
MYFIFFTKYGRVARMCKMRHTLWIYCKSETRREGEYLGVLGIGGRMLLKWFIMTRVARMLTMVMWLMIGRSGECVRCDAVNWSARLMKGGASFKQDDFFFWKSTGTFRHGICRMWRHVCLLPCWHTQNTRSQTGCCSSLKIERLIEGGRREGGNYRRIPVIVVRHN